MSGKRRVPSLRALLILTENHTLVDPHDLDGLVSLAVTAEAAGVDAVMLSEHVALGPSADALGRPANPRAYAAPGNQNPTTAWPSTPVLAGAIARATTRVRIVLGAYILPLRHPVLAAKELATLDRLAEGRLVVQPTVSWHRDEYAALGVDFTRRGAILDEHLEAVTRLWGPSPASFHGEHVSFDDVFCEPKAWRPEGPRLWFGGDRVHPAVLRRLTRYGHGFHPFGSPSADELAEVRRAWTTAGRSLDDLEMIGGTRAVFTGADDVADLDASMADIAAQAEAGYTTFCMKPSQHTDRLDEVPALCTRMVQTLRALS